MSITQHIAIQTKSGYARIILNQGKMLITFYVHRLAVDYTILTLQDVAYIYQDGWNLDNLKKVIQTCEPKITTDKVKRSGIYHE